MEQTDVVIVGSGYGGAIPAARLAEAGLSVVVLERGKRKETADLKQSDSPLDIQEVVDLVVSTSNIAFRTGKLVGGASINMDGAFFRVPQKSFEVKDKTGRRYWPEVFSRAMLDPYFITAEKMMKVRQFGWSEIPKTGGLFAMMLEAAGASCELARLNYDGCLHCGFCSVGCIYDRKQTLMHNYIPLAEKSGAEIRPLSDVRTIEPHPTESGYLLSYKQNGESKQIHGKRVIVGCGGIHTPALLLRSASMLPDLSEQVGRNFSNNGEHAFIGLVPPEMAELESIYCYKGMENAGLMSFHWYESEGFTLHPGAGLEPTILTGNFRADNDPLLPGRSWGMEYKRFAETVYPHRLIGFSALGLADGHADIRITATGAPNIVTTDRTAFDAYADRLESIVLEMGKKSGVTLFPSVPRELAGTTSAHLLSSCRIGQDANSGVVDSNCEVFGYENLYICDASAVPYALAVNPALVISALAERTAEFIIKRG